jgi:penicillin-binding protein 1A
MDSIRYYKKFLRSGLVSIEPTTGHVKAYVGGLNYSYFQYDMAMMGRRQVGSTMKPFVYAMAMEDGMQPTDTIRNIQRTYKVGEDEWSPRNTNDNRYGDYVTLKWGLSQSNNWITAELMYRNDPTGEALVNLLHDYGVANNNFKPSIILSLGAAEITVGEMASGYTAFVNKGMRCAPILVTRIEDAQGKVYTFAPRMNSVISEESSYMMLDMMKGVVEQGTGRRIRNYGINAQVAAKTGTTNDNVDGWFIGCVPKLVTACWVGGEERDIRFNSTSIGQGAATGLPIWSYYMKSVYDDPKLNYSQSDKFVYERTWSRNKDVDSADGYGKAGSNQSNTGEANTSDVSEESYFE